MIKPVDLVPEMSTEDESDIDETDEEKTFLIEEDGEEINEDGEETEEEEKPYSYLFPYYTSDAF